MNLPTLQTGRSRLDLTGACLSWVCALHCIAGPLLLSAGVLGGLGFMVNDNSEYVFIGLSMAVGALSLIPSAIRHRRIDCVLLFTVGIALIAMADHLGESEIVKLAAVGAGAALITSAHLLNRRICRRNCGETQESCSR